MFNLLKTYNLNTSTPNQFSLREKVSGWDGINRCDKLCSVFVFWWWDEQAQQSSCCSSVSRHGNIHQSISYYMFFFSLIKYLSSRLPLWLLSSSSPFLSRLRTHVAFDNLHLGRIICVGVAAKLVYNIHTHSVKNIIMYIVSLFTEIGTSNMMVFLVKQ